MIDYGQKKESPDVGFEQVQFPENSTFKPTFTETLSSVINNNDFVNIAGAVGNIFKNNGLVSVEDPNFDYYDEKHYAGIPTQYWDRVAQAVATGSQREVEATKKSINQELYDMDVLNRSGLTGGALSLTSGVISPTFFIPIGAAAKYATFAKSALSGFKQVLPAAVVSSAISATAQSANKETFGTEAWAHQMIFDTILSSGLGGIIGAKRAFDARGMQKIEGVLNSIHADVDVKIKTNEKGEFLGYEALSGGSASAARVQQVQSFLDNGIAKVGENFFFRQAFKASPIVRALTSPFNTTRQLANRMWKHNLVTGSIEKGYIERIAPAQDIYMDWISLKDAVQSDIKNAWIEYVGIDKGVFKGTRAWREASKKGLLDEKKFREEVGVAMRNGDKHAVPQVEKMAKHVREHLYDKFYNKLVELGKLNPNFDVATAISYLNRVYDKGLILADPEGFVDIAIAHFKDVNNLIDTHMAPLNILKSNITGLKEQLKGKELSKEIKVKLKQELSELNSQFKAKKNEIQGQIDDKTIPLKLLEGREKLTPELQKELEELHKPIMEAKENLDVLKKEKAKNNTPENKAKVKEASAKLKKEKEILKTKLIQEEISPDLVKMNKKGKFSLIPLEEKVWFRKKLPEDKMKSVAEELMATILEENEEQIAGKIFRDISQGSPNPLKNRSYLNEDVNIQRFLVNDINDLMDSYSNTLGKNIALEEMFLKYGETKGEGTEYIIKQLQTEYKNMREELLKKPASKERDGELIALKRDFENEQEFIRDQFKLFMGNLGDPNSKIKRATQALRNYNVATQLGALLLTSLTDIAMPIFRHGFWDHIEKGVVGTIKNFKQLMLDGKAQRADFAHARIACETALGGMLDEKWGAGTQYQPKTAWERVPKNLASLSGNLSFANQFSDLCQTMTAMTSQAKTIEALEHYISGGKLSQKDIERFGLLALNPQEWGQKIMNQVKEHGEFVDGAWIANTRKWTDFDAAQAFRIALRRDVKASLSVQSSMDIPFALRMPVIDCITQYMSWGFGATNNLFIPLLQRADADKIVGIFAMMSIGAMIGPLRDLANGREVDTSPEKLFNGAVFDGGPFGWQADVFSKLNSVMRLPYLQHMQKSTQRLKTPWQVLGGPLGGTMETAQRMLNMFLTGEINQNDFGRSVRLLPFADNVLLRRPIAEGIKATNLPETAAEARALKGED